MNRKIFIAEIALEKMKNFTKKYNKTENGGFIFGRMNPNWIQIFDISDAGTNAKREFSGVELDNKNLLDYVEEKLHQELFIIGTWHSHPKGYGLIPSSIDISTMKKISHHFDEAHSPIFFITGINNSQFQFEIYMIDRNGLPNRLINYELIR